MWVIYSPNSPKRLTWILLFKQYVHLQLSLELPVSITNLLYVKVMVGGIVYAVQFQIDGKTKQTLTSFIFFEAE